MDEALFVGGAPHLIAELDRKAGTTNGFNGCIQKVTISRFVSIEILTFTVDTTKFIRPFCLRYVNISGDDEC